MQITNWIWNIHTKPIYFTGSVFWFNWALLFGTHFGDNVAALFCCCSIYNRRYENIENAVSCWIEHVMSQISMKRFRCERMCEYVWASIHSNHTLNANVQPKQYSAIDILTLTFTTHISRIAWTKLLFTRIMHDLHTRTHGKVSINKKWYRKTISWKFRVWVKWIFYWRKIELRIMQVNTVKYN